MTNNKQQTAVEWFLEELEYKGDLRETPSIKNIQLNIDTSDYMELKQKAKEMEKEKTIKFTEDWYFNGPLLGEGIDVKSTIEQHFNNTYGGGEQ
jgi:thiamine biosynthesis protein ThiC